MQLSEVVDALSRPSSVGLSAGVWYALVTPEEEVDAKPSWSLRARFGLSQQALNELVRLAFQRSVEQGIPMRAATWRSGALGRSLEVHMSGATGH